MSDDFDQTPSPMSDESASLFGMNRTDLEAAIEAHELKDPDYRLRNIDPHVAELVIEIRCLGGKMDALSADLADLRWRLLVLAGFGTGAGIFSTAIVLWKWIGF